MSTLLSWGQALDLIRDNVNIEVANRLVSLVDEILARRLKTKVRSEVVAIAASTAVVFDLTGITDFDFAFAYATEECDVEIVSGENHTIRADGVFMLDGSATLNYLKFTMGSTAGKVAFVIAG